jgi:antitoxin (DNA-binding transcriptional repressor) of toxin-antitoxin stability system
MKMVNIADAKAHLSDYLKLVERGEVIVLARRNEPVAELRALPRKQRRPRPAGLCKDEFQVPAAFDEPLPEPLLRDFEGR